MSNPKKRPRTNCVHKLHSSARNILYKTSCATNGVQIAVLVGNWCAIDVQICTPFAHQPHLGLPYAQASAVWQLFNYAEWLAQCKGRVLFRMNLDESAICMHPGAGRGAVFVSKKRLREDRDCRQHVAFAKKRCYLSYVSIICDRPDVQPLLPQFIIANERTLLKRDLPTLIRAAPPNVRLLRQRSAWNTARLTVRIVGLLGDALRALRGRLSDIQPLLLLDAAKIHLHGSVLRACKAYGFWVLVIPPRMTFALQPLDAHVFSSFKRELVYAYQAARLGSSAYRGDIGIAEWLGCVYTAIAKVIDQRAWANAFDYCGFGHGQSAVSHHLRSTLRLEGTLELPALPPPDDIVRLCFPRGLDVDMALYWSLFEDVAPRRPLLRRSAPLGAVTSESVSEIVPWRAPRTRSEHRGAAAAAEAIARLARVGAAAGVAPPRALLRRYRRADALDAD